MTRQSHIEAVALALLDTDLVTRDEAEQFAAAAITALEKLGAYVGEGWEAVPSEPTPEQCGAGAVAIVDTGAGDFGRHDHVTMSARLNGKEAAEVYRKMLAAKPKPAQGKE